MIVSDLMTSPARACSADSPCSTAAQIMWDADCGCVPVTDVDGRLAGIVTDRDLCMATHTTGLPLSAIPVRRAMAAQPTTVALDATVAAALAQMASAQVHRLPVVDAEHRVVGVLALSDVIAHRAGSLGKSADSTITTLAAITQRRSTERVVEIAAPAAAQATARSTTTAASPKSAGKKNAAATKTGSATPSRAPAAKSGGTAKSRPSQSKTPRNKR